MRQSKRFRRALQGLEAMIVWVHNLEKEASEDGLSRQHLQDLVVIRLLDAGIRALGIGNVPEPPGNPWLNIFVNTVKEGDHYFFYLVARLDEVVRPERNRAARTIGTTWESSTRGVVRKDQLHGTVEKEMDELIDCFIYDYFMENPR